MHGSCRLHSCIFCRRSFGAARPCPGNGRAVGDDHHFSVRAAWHPGGFGYRDRLGHLSSAGGVFRLSHCAGLVASVVCSLAGLLFGVPYLLSDKTPRIDGKQLELQFEFRAPSTVKIPDQPDGYSIRASLYLDNRQSEFAFITGAPSQKMPNRSQSRDVLPYSRIARADRSSHRSVMRRKRRSSSS